MPVTVSRTIKFFNQLFSPLSLIFDIETSDTNLIESYLKYGVNVISCDPKAHLVSTRDNITVTSNSLLQEKIGTDMIIDNLIANYGMPSYCVTHIAAGSVYSCLKSLSKKIKCVAFKFDVRHNRDLVMSLQHLSKLGYDAYNFSTRDLPGFILEDNRYLNTQKEWAKTPQELLDEIEAFAQLDHDGTKLWGYIYARSF